MVSPNLVGSTNLANLAQTPAQLMSDAVGALLDPASGVSVSQLALTIPKAGQVLVVPAPNVLAQPSWPYYGHAIASFQPADLGAVLGPMDLKLVPDVPSRSGDIANTLAAIFEIALSPSDVIDEPIPSITTNGQVYVLRASPSSTMWTGQVTIRLYQTSTQGSSS